MLGMSTVDSKAESWPTDTVFEPSLHDIGNERFLVHCDRKIILLVIAAKRTDALQVGMRRGENLEIRQIALIDEVLCRRRNDEPFVISPQSLRRRGCR